MKCDVLHDFYYVAARRSEWRGGGGAYSAARVGDALSLVTFDA